MSTQQGETMQCPSSTVQNLVLNSKLTDWPKLSAHQLRVFYLCLSLSTSEI